MQVILHIGVHCTDDDLFLKTMLRNTEAFRADGVAIPGPSRYRQLLSDLVNSLSDTQPTDEAREVLLDALLDNDPGYVDRLVLSHPNILSVPKLALAGGKIYRHAENRVQTMAELFRGDELEVFVGLRNPATYLPAVYAATPHTDFAEFLGGVDPLHLRWSDLIQRMRLAAPDVPITVWCNEDTPLIWGQVIREAAGIDLTRKITGAFEVFSNIIKPEGMKRFRAFLKENPDINERQKRRVMTAFLDKYALEDEIEQELDLPGWDEAYVDMLTELYEDDLFEIERMPGVTVIAP
ncbi:hypothetical protein KUH32_18290 [Thalassococcus sp. CAU 1522]|uniref:Sulfotransferase domain-containing protein n=1 Tax=Thalassococcus arenae TaxID=2851652 RepID=A0ABS6NDN5_9RHOB|nr:hypothetical protein [Thalassococcus arenae]MBV2361719.1 hypothetical protein [Thalassococcus arenae]